MHDWGLLRTPRAGDRVPGPFHAVQVAVPRNCLLLSGSGAKPNDRILLDVNISRVPTAPTTTTSGATMGQPNGGTALVSGADAPIQGDDHHAG